MKRITLTFLSLLLVACAFAQNSVAPKKDKKAPSTDPAFEWAATDFDFGKIKLNVPVSHEFTFTNTGATPLVISTVQASCGCTVTAYSKEPIQPNGTGYVKATFNAASLGRFTKTVTVNANTEEGVIKLTIQGEVVSGEVIP
jgi:hypothetical protein